MTKSRGRTRTGKSNSKGPGRPKGEGKTNRMSMQLSMPTRNRQLFVVFCHILGIRAASCFRAIINDYTENNPVFIALLNELDILNKDFSNAINMTEVEAISAANPHNIDPKVYVKFIKDMISYSNEKGLIIDQLINYEMFNEIQNSIDSSLNSESIENVENKIIGINDQLTNSA